MIYLCRNKRNGYVKIGFSITPELREKTLQSEEPELFFEHTFPGTTMDDESELHRRYASRRLRGEWFELTPQDVTEIISIYAPPQEGVENLPYQRKEAIALFTTILSAMDGAAMDDVRGILTCLHNKFPVLWGHKIASFKTTERCEEAVHILGEFKDLIADLADREVPF